MAFRSTKLVDRALNWLFNKFKQLQNLVRTNREAESLKQDQYEGDWQSIVTDGLKNPVSYPQFGNMYLFRYDAKWGEKLPYWDAQPLVIPFEPRSNGFLGINFHYLPFDLRKILLDKLLNFLDGNQNSQYLNFAYNDIRDFTKFAEVKPTIKYYLNRHMRSRFLPIQTDEWNTAIYLPTEEFVKSTKFNVWLDSRRKIRNA